MFTPKQQKFRKAHRNRGGLKGKAYRGGTISFGDFGLKAMTKGEVSSRQIEAARRAVSRYVARGGKIWIRIFPQKPITKKAAEVPMGSGKGNVEFYVAAVKPGTVLLEIAGVDEATAREAMSRAAHKLPVICRFARPYVR